MAAVTGRIMALLEPFVKRGARFEIDSCVFPRYSDAALRRRREGDSARIVDEGRFRMLQVHTFMSKTTPQALEYGDQHINEWLAKHGVKVVFVNQSSGTIEAKTGARESVLFINVWYEVPDKGASAHASSHATASAPAAPAAAEPILDLEPEA